MALGKRKETQKSICVTTSSLPLELASKSTI
jgi:hypothetical protein